MCLLSCSSLFFTVLCSKLWPWTWPSKAFADCSGRICRPWVAFCTWGLHAILCWGLYLMSPCVSCPSANAISVPHCQCSCIVGLCRLKHRDYASWHCTDWHGNIQCSSACQTWHTCSKWYLTCQPRTRSAACTCTVLHQLFNNNVSACRHVWNALLYLVRWWPVTTASENKPDIWHTDWAPITILHMTVTCSHNSARPNTIATAVTEPNMSFWGQRSHCCLTVACNDAPLQTLRCTVQSAGLHNRTVSYMVCVLCSYWQQLS